MRQNRNLGQQGFILVWALLLMIVVTLLGVAGISTSIFEERMAANEALHQQTFLMADSGVENGLALLVENVNCISTFQTTPSGDGGITIPDGNIRVSKNSLNFWLSNNFLGKIKLPTDPAEGVENRDYYYPASYSSGEPHTNGRINGQTILMTGANLPMMAGYEGKGKALGQDGAFLEYDIRAEHLGVRNSRATVSTKFRLDNQFANYPAGGCNY